jgi:hypothetical protein
MPIKPIFIFSISRSGSTLVQRIVAAHDGVATVAEPWLLLPYLYTLRPRGVIAEYVHPLMVDAIEDFSRELPQGAEDYRAELRNFVLRLYEKAAGDGARYFVDKTPPYYLVADEIVRLFPEGKFVFLWRNPLSVIASIIETLNHGRWQPTLFRGDLFIGLPRLVSVYQENRSRAYSVRFEDLLTSDQAWAQLVEYLGIEFDPQSLQQFSEVKLSGRMGDPTGVKQYSALSTEPTQKWKATLANPIRKQWCLRYLRHLGDERLAVMGYDGERLRGELSAQPNGTESLMADIWSMLVDISKEPVRVRVLNKGLGGPNVIRNLLSA